MDRVESWQLAGTLRALLLRYVTYSPHADLYAIFDDQRQIYTVTGIERQPMPDQARAFVVVQARISNNTILIDEDSIWDHEDQLHTALIDAGIPPQQIVLAYSEQARINLETAASERI